MNMHHYALVSLPLLLGSASAHAASFQPIGFVQSVDQESLPTAVSGDGRTVIGVSGTSTSHWEAFRWTADTGIQGLGYLGPQDPYNPTPYSSASDVSYDGGVIVGQSSMYGEGQRIFEWRASTGMVALPKYDSTYITNRDGASAVSADGTALAGFGQGPSGNTKAISYFNGQYTTLGQIPGTYTSYATDMSGDGSKIVGYAYANYESGDHQAFLWTQATGMQGLGSLPGGNGFSQANGISADGTTVVGYASTDLGNEAFLWHAAGGMMALGVLGSGTQMNSYANAASADGSVVVGTNIVDGVRTAFVWDAQHGMRSLQEVLQTDFNLDLSGWQLGSVSDVSYDGKVFVGTGINPNGKLEAWAASTVPEPAPLWNLLGGLALVSIMPMLRRRALPTRVGCNTRNALHRVFHSAQ